MADDEVVIPAQCAMKQTCVVTASSAIFGDPCPGTRKYLEVHYECVAGHENMYSILSSADKTDHILTSCPPTVSRNISWDWTRRGQEAIEPCPRGSVDFWESRFPGRAKWYCVDAVTTVHWSDALPDLSECQSPWAESLKRRIDGGDSVVSIAAELAVITRTKPLYGGDITQILTILHRLVSKMEDRVHIMNEKQRYHVILEMLHVSV
ncbi:latrophilin Cirl-like [Limulus polyphemus]|uniref:Latrophilin Cirl-like n=1 Tax=Limulus polyphemus TaxID=6850 RepID=A0ABM1S0F4_LIMPO|nr:latrophilin Cirl-like [Limulus polyphemus]